MSRVVLCFLIDLFREMEQGSAMGLDRDSALLASTVGRGRTEEEQGFARRPLIGVFSAELRGWYGNFYSLPAYLKMPVPFAFHEKLKVESEHQECPPT